MRVYVDGTLRPRHYMLQDLFERRDTEFATQLVAQQSGGSYCYLPVPFSESIRIATNGTVRARQAIYYNIGYHRYAPGTPIVAWTGSEDVSQEQAVWNKAATGADSTPRR